MLKKCKPYSPTHSSCDVCLSEKAELIAHCKDPKNVNKKTDLGTRCIHKKNFLLDNVT